MCDQEVQRSLGRQNMRIYMRVYIILYQTICTVRVLKLYDSVRVRTELMQLSREEIVEIIVELGFGRLLKLNPRQYALSYDFFCLLADLNVKFVKLKISSASRDPKAVMTQAIFKGNLLLKIFFSKITISPSP